MNTSDGNGSNQGASSGHGHETLVDLEGSLKRLDGDRDLFNEFINIFLEDSPPLLQEIENSVDAGDAAELAKSSHALKGLLLNFGSNSCVDIALMLERAGHSGELKNARQDLEKLRPFYADLCAELAELLGQQ